MVVILQDEFLGSILTLFTIFDISPLWMDQFWKNWWPNCRFFDALTDSGKIFDQYDPQNFWQTLEAGAKNWIFSPIWSLGSQNLSTSEQEKDEKLVSKLNYSSSANQWCNLIIISWILGQFSKAKSSGPILSPRWPKLPKNVILSYPLTLKICQI